MTLESFDQFKNREQTALPSVNRCLMWLTSTFSEVLEANTERKTRALLALLGTVVTIGMWLLHLSYPYLFDDLFHRHRLNKIFVALVLAPPFVAAFSIGHFMFPKVSAPVEHASGPMSGYLQITKAERNWRIGIAAGVMTAANFLMMMATSHPR